jgi:GAF domain-containing protein
MSAQTIEQLQAENALLSKENRDLACQLIAAKITEHLLAERIWQRTLIAFAAGLAVMLLLGVR